MSDRHEGWARLLTPPGSGAIGVIRVEGPDAVHIVRGIFRSRRADDGLSTSPGEIRYGHVLDGEQVVDDVLVVSHRVDAGLVVDVCAHGGVRVIEQLLDLLHRCGAPLRTDDSSPPPVWAATNVIQHEAFDLMARAKTPRVLRFLSWQSVHLPDALATIRAMVIDHPQRTCEALEALARRAETARLLVDGATVAIVGPPNGGKSTLFNRLIGRVSAVVSPHAGTTRDWVEAAIEFSGIPITLIDTAGRRATSDTLERRAIQTGQARAERADLLIAVVDAGRQVAPLALSALLQAPRRAGVVWVQNKIDKESDVGVASQLPRNACIVRLSARTGDGVDTLVRALVERFGLDPGADRLPTCFTARQVRIISQIRIALRPTGAQEPIARDAADDQWDELIGPRDIEDAEA